MTSFKPLNTRIFQKNASVVTPDFIYWKQLNDPVLVKEFGPIDYIDFSPVEPYYFSVTCSARVQIYNPITKLVAKNLSKFKETAYGGVFRSDGRLLCAGSEEASVKLFDVPSKSLLRLFKGHEAAVHRTYFVEGKPQIASFSDDKTVKIWDIPTEKEILSYTDHTDYVRAGATSAALPDIILSGGYDNCVKMYDTRSNQTVLNLNHGSPIESLLFLPSGSIFLSAGGTEIKIWDMIAGGKLLGSISQHHKTITCLRLASDNKRLMSGSLDRHVKIYDLSSFQVVHTLDYQNAILSLGVSQNDETVVAGLVNGVVAISRRQEGEKPKTEEKKQISFQHTINLHRSTVDAVIPEYDHNAETKYDRCLRKFEFSKALDFVLVPYVATKKPEVTVSVMQELIKRRALKKAFIGRDASSTALILRFFIRNITDLRFAKVLIDAANIFLDTYEENPVIVTPEIMQLLKQLTRLLREEAALADELAKLQGTMHMLLSAATIHTEQQKDTVQHLIPSADAQKDLVINIK